MKPLLSGETPVKRGRLALGCLAAALLIAALTWSALRGDAHHETIPSPNANVETAKELGRETRNIGYRELPFNSSSPNKNAVTSNGLGATPKELLEQPSFSRSIEGALGEALGSGASRPDLATVRAALAERVRSRFPPEFAEHAIAFAQRYLDYLGALDALNLPSAAQNVAQLRSVFEMRKALREAYFSAAEYEVMFARDDRLDRYTIARFEIQADEKLTQAQKSSAIEAAANALTPEERRERADLQSHLALQRQTEHFNQQQTSDEERFAARAREHGEAAAQRLAALDRAERDWQARLAQYERTVEAQRRGEVTSDQLIDTQRRLFTESERLRLDAAIALRRK